MLSLEELELNLQRSNDVHEAQAKRKIAEIQHDVEEYNKAVSKLKGYLPNIIEGLKQSGLSVTQLTYSPTGSGDGHWDKETSLRVSINAVPNSGKFKFIAFNGYTARGSGKNQARLDAKAEKIESTIQLFTKINDVQVNQSSLESRDSKKNNVVLITLWIK